MLSQSAYLMAERKGKSSCCFLVSCSTGFPSSSSSPPAPAEEASSSASAALLSSPASALTSSSSFEAAASSLPPFPPLVLPLLLLEEDDVESSSLDSDSFLTLPAALPSSPAALLLFVGEAPLALEDDAAAATVEGEGEAAAAASDAAVSVSSGSGSWMLNQFYNADGYVDTWIYESTLQADCGGHAPWYS